MQYEHDIISRDIAKIVLFNLYWYRPMYSSFQVAFKKNHGTNDHIYTLRTLINKYVRHYKLKLYCCFVDFRKAFDSVWRDGLFYKLRKLGVGGNMYKVLRNMYNETESCVKLPGGLTQYYSTTAGIKQRESLSPVLFIIFIDDVCNIFDPITCGAVSLGDTYFNTLIYADDLLILSNNSKDLQNAINKLHSYCNIWALVNIQKTKVIYLKIPEQYVMMITSI